MKQKISRIAQFMHADIWRIRSNQLKGSKQFLIRNLRVLLLSFRGFDEDKCQLRASALTYYSLLSIVPVIAMAFGIAKGFGFEQKFEQLLMKNMQGQEEVVMRILEFSRNMLENTRGGLIAGIGVALLFWAVIKVLGQIETSFNDIWGVKKSRSLPRKFADYLSIMLICPVLLIASSSVTVLIAAQITMLVNKLSFLGPVGSLILLSLKILPYAVLWVVFTFLYIFMPNTKVQFKSGLIAGILAGTLYQLVQWAYITFQVGASKFGAIYGSFAALPLFLVWLQLSWLVVLLGAEIAFAEQNVDTYEFEPDCLKVSRSFKQLVSLVIMHACVKRFHLGQPPQISAEIARQFEIPIRLTREVIFELTEAGLLVEVVNESKQMAYQPARDIERLTLKEVLETLNNHGSDNIPVAQTPETEKFRKSFSAFAKTIEKMPENYLLKDV